MGAVFTKVSRGSATWHVVRQSGPPPVSDAVAPAAGDDATASNTEGAASGSQLDRLLLEGRFLREDDALLFEWPLSTIRSVTCCRNSVPCVTQ